MQTHIATDPCNMGIDGHNQLFRADFRPQAGIDIVATDHPSQKEIEAFAGAFALGTADEVFQSARKISSIEAIGFFG